METFSYVIQLGKRLGIALLIFSISRILFYLFNLSYFPNAGFGDFLYALRFDASAISWIYLPFILFSILPIGIRSKKNYQIFLKFLFHLSNTICVTLNGIDIEYFKFTLKRSTSDLLQLMQLGDDVTTLIPTFLADFWYIVLIGAVLVLLSEFLYRKTALRNILSQTFSIKRTSIHFGLMVGVLGIWLVTSRGGFQLIPISVIDAGFFTKTENVPLVLNTPFAFIKSLENPNLKEVEYMPQEEATSLVPLIKTSSASSTANQPNVVILVLESFSNEYIGYFNPESKFTPYLDKLLDESLVFTKCYANGKKSIEGIPAITAGLPTLMDNPFISSPYSTNQFNSLPSHLKQIGYSSSFYHGGANGTMGFEAFCDMAGFDEYIGMNQYPDKEKDYDGNWGIFDEPFFQYFAAELDEQPQPFFSTFFSLSSHHPYTIPEQHKGKFLEGPLPILKSVMYADYALHEFFETAKTKDWFSNTMFILTADHTSKLITPKYSNNVGNYAIPLAIYYPAKDSLFKGTVDKVVQQIDIMPTVLNYLNYPKDYFAFGNDYTSNQSGYSVSFINGKYQIIEDDYALQFDGNKNLELFHYPSDTALDNNIYAQKKRIAHNMEQKLKAFVQQYNSHMIHNQLRTE